eukprot:8036373-Alexandrium_andersonii.AAC.1
MLRYVRLATGVRQTLEPNNCPGTLQFPYRPGGEGAKGLEPADIAVGTFGLSKCTGPTPPPAAEEPWPRADAG